MARWQYNRFSDDHFLLVLRTPDLQDPLIAEMREVLDENVRFDQNITGYPTDDLHSPTGWRGFFGLSDGVIFRIHAIYCFPGFFGLVCDTEDGNHSQATVEALLDAVNASE